MKNSGIYKIQSIIKPERCYIGSAVCIGKRWNEHLRTLRKGNHKNSKLQNHFNKYGKNDFIFSIIICCDKEDLIITEQFFIDSYKPWFNLCKIAGNTLGIHFKLSEETKIKISNSHKGINVWMKGRHLSEETKLKQSKALKGRKISEEAKLSVSKAQKGNTHWLGRHHSEKTKQKLSIIGMGHSVSEEVRKKIREANIGRVPVNKGKKGKPHTEEWKKQTSDRMKGNKYAIRNNLKIA